MDENGSARWSWQKLVWLAPTAIGATFLIFMLFVFGFDPFFLIFIVVVFAAGYVGRRFPRRAGPITVIVVSTLLVLLNLPFIVEDLSHPESVIGFMSSVIPLTLVILGVVAGIAVLRSASGERAPTAFYTAVGVIVLGLVVGVVAAAGLEDDTPAPGDVRLVAESVEFSLDSIPGSGESVGVFIENKDPFRHTFTIKDLDIDVELPANTARRVEITAPAGTYEFICAVPGHEEKMSGTLTIG